jgi:hypothetical protein
MSSPLTLSVTRLTRTEIDFLLDLIRFNEQEGSWCGGREQYEKRREQVKKKLEAALLQLVGHERSGK